MTEKDFIKRLNNVQKELKQAINRDIPMLAGNQAVKMFKENFRREAFFGSKWKEVKRRKDPKTKGAARSRKILTGQTGNLGRSLQMTPPTNGTVTVFSDVKYAAIHNEGGRAGRKRSALIPKRQFIGSHKKLDNAINKIVQKSINKIFNV